MTSNALSRRLTQADIARLAGVRRPVVSMWRQRYKAGDRPFPGACGTEGGIDVFDYAEVVHWLGSTGRGTNAYVVDEAPLHTAPPVAGVDAFRLTEALVVLGGTTGEALTGLDADDILALAEDVDLDDRCLLSEVATADADHLTSLAPYVDALLSASFGTLDALNRLDERAAAFGATPHGWRVSAPLRDLVWDLAEALAARRSRDKPPALVDPLGGGGLLYSGPDRAWDGAVVLPAASYAGPDEEGDEAEGSLAARRSTRAAWRRLRAAGVDVTAATNARAGGSQGSSQKDAELLVAAMPDDGHPSLDAAELIITIDEALDKLGEHQQAIVIGPASALTDALPDASNKAAQTRTNMLRRGVLRAAIRLGPGGLVDRPQLHLAMWVFGAAREFKNHPHLRTATADLTGRDLAAVADDLVIDLVAVVDDSPPPLSTGEAVAQLESASRVFRLVRHELTSDVLDEERALVVRDAVAGESAADLGSAGRRAGEQVDVLAPAIADPLPGLRLRVSPTPEGAPANTAAPMTVGALVTARRLKVVAGIRLAPRLVADGPDAAGHPVVGAPEVVGGAPVGSRRVDLLAFAAAHPNAQLTAPGDVVFTTSPSPAAWVDADGGSVVEFPARVLRVVDTGHAALPQRILPRVLAADLAAMPGKQWRSASVRLIPAEHAARLTRVLDAAADARAAALARAAHLENLTTLLADGVAGGSITATLDASTEEGH